MGALTVVSRARFMDVREAAELLRLSPKTLYGLVSQRRIPFRKAGRRLLFLESELLEWTRPHPDRRSRYGELTRRQ
jgi:excisionase family DNA binding protein